MRFRPFRKDDWYMDGAIEPIEIPCLDGLEKAERGVAITAEDSQGVIGCGGIAFWDDRTGELWVRLSGRIKEQPLQAIDAICAGFRILKDSVDVDIFCRCEKDFAKANRLAKWLGFRPTEQYTQYNGKQYLIYRL